MNYKTFSKKFLCIDKEYINTLSWQLLILPNYYFFVTPIIKLYLFNSSSLPHSKGLFEGFPCLIPLKRFQFMDKSCYVASLTAILSIFHTELLGWPYKTYNPTACIKESFQLFLQISSQLGSLSFPGIWMVKQYP